LVDILFGTREKLSVATRIAFGELRYEPGGRFDRAAKQVGIVL
jgi:hypothetical protein